MSKVDPTKTWAEVSHEGPSTPGHAVFLGPKTRARSKTLPNSNTLPDSKTIPSRDTIYVYIDQSNFWISAKEATGKKHWKYSARRLRSLLLQETTIAKTVKDFDKRVNIYGRIPKAVDAMWTSEHAKVHPYGEAPPEDRKKAARERRAREKVSRKEDSDDEEECKEDAREKEVDTSLVADSVEEAVKASRRGLSNIKSEFVIVSGDRDMRPAVEKIIKYGHAVHVWSWERSLSHVFRELESKNPGLVTVHLLDDEQANFEEVLP
ncbi:hypothetical protein Neosp_014876 [[Neocosmospora] mangrovei]